MPKTKSQPELTLELKMDNTTNIGISGIKLKCLSEENDYGVNYNVQVFDEIQLKYI